MSLTESDIESTTLDWLFGLGWNTGCGGCHNHLSLWDN